MSEWVRENYDPMPTRNWSSGENSIINTITFSAVDNYSSAKSKIIRFLIQDHNVIVHSGFRNRVGPIDIRDPDSLTQISNAIKRELRRGTNVS